MALTRKKPARQGVVRESERMRTPRVRQAAQKPRPTALRSRQPARQASPRVQPLRRKTPGLSARRLAKQARPKVNRAKALDPGSAVRQADFKRLKKSLPTPTKAGKMLRDGKVRGKKLTKKQKGLFGAIRGSAKTLGRAAKRAAKTIANPVGTAKKVVKKALSKRRVGKKAKGIGLTQASKKALKKGLMFQGVHMTPAEKKRLLNDKSVMKKLGRK